MPTIFMTGVSGMLGRAWIEHDKKNLIKGVYNSNRVGMEDGAHMAGNILDPVLLENQIVACKPTLIIHAAAMTDIEVCEADPNQAFDVNVVGTRNVAEIAAKIRVPLVYISTDFVFNGEQGFYEEDDKPDPKTVYGKTKWGGEKEVQKASPDHLIVRVNFFGHNKKKPSFPDFLLNQSRQGEGIVLAQDQYYNPIEITHFIEAVHALLNAEVRGIIHLGCREAVSRSEFAETLAEVFNIKLGELQRMSLVELGRKFGWKAERPHNTTLNIARASKWVSLPSLRETLEQYRMVSLTNVSNSIE